MEKLKQIDVLDLIIVVIKRKMFLIFFFTISIILTYLSIFFFVEEKYDAYATIIPTQESNMASIGGLLGDISGLPFGLGLSSSPDMVMYKNIIFSRTNLEKVIRNFDLYSVFEVDTTLIDYRELTLKKLSNSIEAEENEYQAFQLKVRMNDPYLAAKITNFIIKSLNEKLVNLKIQKSSNDRVFLEERLAEIRIKLKSAEDSLLIYQKSNKIFDAEEQIKEIISTYSQLETELIIKQIQKNILEKVQGKESPQLQNIYYEVEEYQNKIAELKNVGQNESLLLPLDTLPNKALGYFRRYREVEINSAILKFIIPLYEQAKLEEQKDIPVLQVIDYAVPILKKSYPPRVLLTLLINIGFFAIVLVILFLFENKSWFNSDKMDYIRKNIFKI